MTFCDFFVGFFIWYGCVFCSFSKRGQIQRGQALIDRVLDLDPENLDAIIVKAWVTMEGGDLTQSEKYFQRALQQDPRNAEALYYYGKYWQKRGNCQKVLSIKELLGQVFL